MPEPVIELNDLCKSYTMSAGVMPVLQDVQLRVDAGERLAIIGRSGSGKSTLLSILGCLDRPTSGRYQLAGNDVAKMDDDALSSIRCDHIGFVFQAFHLLESRTVLGNVELPMEYRGVPGDERRRRALELVERVGLADRGGHHPHQLSGGEKQRVAIARALANRPQLLLADEPTGNLDLESQGDVLDLLVQLHRETNLTLILVTHDMAVGRLARRICRLTRGRLEELEPGEIDHERMLKS